MRIVAQPRPSPARIDAIAVSMRAWVVGLLVWFCEVLDAVSPALRARPGFGAHLAHIKAGIARDLRRGAQIARLYLIAAAFAAEDLPARRPRYHPPYLKRRRLSARAYQRAATCGAMPALRGGSLRQRAEALRRFLDRADLYVRHTLRRLRALHAAGPIRRAIVSAARAQPLPTRIPPTTLCAFDTS